MAPPSSADEHEVTITGVASDGEGVARLADGRVVFVRGALPGDRVVARETQAKARVVFADTVRLLTPSASRVAGLCLLEACDGCAFKHLDYQAQLSAKADTVLQAVTRIARVDAGAVFRGVVAGDPWHYRHRVRLHARHSGQWRLGYHARGTHDLVPIEACPVLWPELEAAVRAFSAWLSDKPAAWGVREVEIAYSRVDGAAAAEIHADRDVDGPWPSRRLRYDQPRPFDLWFEPGVFTQANARLNALLVDAVVAGCSGAPRVLELHAGIGNFSLPLAAAGHVVRATEGNPRSSALAGENARGAGPAIETLAVSDAKAVTQARDFDVVLMDPPRAGAREASTALAREGPARVVYVSCDPGTLARDIQILVAGGYTLASLQAFDMFPQTPHIESLAVLNR